MAIVPSVGNLINISVTHTNVQSATAINVLYYKVVNFSGSIPGMTTFLGAVATSFLEGYGARWENFASQDVRLVGVRATNVFPLPRSVGIARFPAGNQNGLQPSEALPLQDTPTLLKRTAVGNRWGLGRIFVVGIAEGGQKNGVLENLTVEQINMLGSWLATPLDVPGTGWNATLQPVLKRGPEDNPVSITDILEVRLSDAIIKTQRRRRPGKGI